MKHLFIINPAAGKKDRSAQIAQAARETMERLGEDYEIYLTRAPMDAARYIKESAQSGERIRVYACGGDGTLNEAINGAAGLENVEITHFPCGTGNDFVKMFGDDAALFCDISALAEGSSVPLDLIKVGDRYGVNICSIGVDARIGGDVHKYSKLPLVSGQGAYIVSLIVNLIKGIGREMSISIDDTAFPNGKYSLLCCCNGRYYGGGFNPVPEAQPDDGELDFLVVKNVTRIGFLRMVGKYSKGRYREMSDTITHKAGKRLELSAPDEFAVNIDGEIVRGRKAVFELVPGAVRFVFPKKASFLKTRAAV